MKKLLYSLAILAAGAGGFAVFAQSAPESKPDTDLALNRNLTVFNAISRYLAQVYVDSLRPDDTFQAAIGAMLNTVDPYTEYYDSNQRQLLEIMTTGEYGGIGAYITSRDGDVFISLPIEGSPSHKAGMRPGDRILKIDSVTATGKTSDFVSSRLKGDPGTPVTVTVQRPYVADSILTFTLMRERIRNKSVPFAGMVGDGIGYVKLNSFMDKSASEVKAALEKFKANPELKGVVLDLRDNGGGLVESAVEILGMFLPRGTKVMETKGHNPNSFKTYATERSPLLPDVPLVVLIDEGSASASEITAGAIQDLDRGVLVGRRSFGKGLVQGTLSLPYDGLLKVTTAKYHLPSGRLIQAIDYSRRNPDGSVARTPDSLTNEFRTRAGRIVRDGGGLVPDSVTKLPDYSHIIYNLMVSNQIFDYATLYAATHPEIAPAKDFRVTDEIFEDFLAFVDTTKVKNDKSIHRLLEDLRKTARVDGYMTDELAQNLDSLERLLDPDVKQTIRNRREEVNEYLGREIVGRYYNRSGEEEYSLLFDGDFAVARDILSDPTLYKSILTPDGATKKK